MGVPFRRKALLILAMVVLAYAYGALTAAVPAPDDPDQFWVSNLGAPYVALPFVGVIVALSTSSIRWWTSAGITGAVITAAIVAGFYGLHLVGRHAQADIGEQESLGEAYLRWLSTFVFGIPGGLPWISIGVVAGATAGVLAWWWRTRRSVGAGVLGVSPLIVEGAARLVAADRGLPLAGGFPRTPANVVIWAIELGVGAAAVWAVACDARARDRVKA
jgi:hypothetical protein